MNSTLSAYKDLIVGTINNILVPIIIAIAFIVFLWGVFKYYIKGAEDESSRASGHQFILWGIIGFVIITSVWALVNIASSILIPSDVNKNNPTPPKINLN